MPTGARTSYTDTNVKARSISQAIFMIDWTEAPLLNLFGIGKENIRKFDLINFPATKVEWVEDSMSPLASAVAGSHNNSTTTLAVATGNGAYFRKGDVLLVESEQMLVTAVSADNLTVTRGYGGSTAASHADTVAIKLVTRAMPEGSDYTTGHTTTTNVPYNYAQILSEAAQATKTAMAVKNVTKEDELDYQVSKLFADGGKAGKLAQLLANTFYYGLRVQRTASAYGSLGGFKTFVTTNVTDLSSASLQKSDIHALIRKVRDAGGAVTDIITGSWGIEKITSMYEGLLTMDQDSQLGGSKITKILTPHGQVNVVYDWMCPAGELHVVNRNKIGWLPIRDFSMTKIAEQGDYYVTDVVGEYTLAVANEKSHGYIKNFSTTS